jgi:hypothetical protein
MNSHANGVLRTLNETAFLFLGFFRGAFFLQCLGRLFLVLLLSIHIFAHTGGSCSVGWSVRCMMNLKVCDGKSKLHGGFSLYSSLIGFVFPAK